MRGARGGERGEGGAGCEREMNSFNIHFKWSKW